MKFEVRIKNGEWTRLNSEFFIPTSNFELQFLSLRRIFSRQEDRMNFSRLDFAQKSARGATRIRRGRTPQRERESGRHLPPTVVTEFVSKRGALSVSQTFQGHPAIR